MLSRDEGDLEHVVDLDIVPPVEFMHIFEPKRADDACVTGGSKHGWREVLPELLERRGVQVVIVIVTEEDDIDRRQVPERNAGLTHPLGTYLTKWACARRPHRVREHGDAVGL